MTLIDHEPLWTTPQVATFLRVSPATVRRLARNGDLPSVRVGRQLRFDVDQLVKPQRVHAPRGHANRTNGRNGL